MSLRVRILIFGSFSNSLIVKVVVSTDIIISLPQILDIPFVK